MINSSFFKELNDCSDVNKDYHYNRIYNKLVSNYELNRFYLYKAFELSTTEDELTEMLNDVISYFSSKEEFEKCKKIDIILKDVQQLKLFI